VPGGDRDDASDGDDEVNTDVEESDEDVPAGPIDPERCVANGPGISGAEAGAPVNVIIVARDSNNHRVREGGAHVFVCVEPTGPGARDAEPIEAKVTDHGNGTYTAQYAVPSKGNYELSIEVNGEPIGASPFPVFFSAAGKDTGTGGTGEGATPPPSVSQLGTEAQAAPTGVAINMLPNLSNSTLSFSMVRVKLMTARNECGTPTLPPLHTSDELIAPSSHLITPCTPKNYKNISTAPAFICRIANACHFM